MTIWADAWLATKPSAAAASTRILRICFSLTCIQPVQIRSTSPAGLVMRLWFENERVSAYYLITNRAGIVEENRKEPTMQRREFLVGTLATAGTIAATATPAVAIDPIRREGRSLLKLSLAAYSFRQVLNLTRKPPTMTLAGFIDLAATMPFEAVEL